MIGHAVADSNGIVLAVDQNICDLLQRSKRDIVDAVYLSFLDRTDRAKVKAVLERQAVDSAPSEHRARMVSADGSRIWVEFQVSRFAAGTGENRLVASVQWDAPTPEERRAERLLTRASSLHRFLSVRRQLLGSDLNGEYDLIILIHVYLAEAAGKSITIREVCAAAALSHPVAHRWLRALVARDLICTGDGLDEPLDLTDSGFMKIERILTSLSLN